MLNYDWIRTHSTERLKSSKIYVQCQNVHSCSAYIRTFENSYAIEHIKFVPISNRRILEHLNIREHLNSRIFEHLKNCVLSNIQIFEKNRTSKHKCSPFRWTFKRIYNNLLWSIIIIFQGKWLMISYNMCSKVHRLVIVQASSRFLNFL